MWVPMRRVDMAQKSNHHHIVPQRPKYDAPNETNGLAIWMITPRCELGMPALSFEVNTKH